MLKNARVTVTDVNINTHEKTQQLMWLRSHWAVNATKPLSATVFDVARNSENNKGWKLSAAA